jgi:hypothetical protein
LSLTANDPLALRQKVKLAAHDRRKAQKLRRESDAAKRRFVSGPAVEPSASFLPRPHHNPTDIPCAHARQSPPP